MIFGSDILSGGVAIGEAYYHPDLVGNEATLNGMKFLKTGVVASPLDYPDGAVSGGTSLNPSWTVTSVGVGTLNRSTSYNTNGRVYRFSTTVGAAPLTTIDGATWDTCVLPSYPSSSWKDAVFDGTYYYLIGGTAPVVLRSSDGITFTALTFPTTAGDLYRIFYVNSYLVVIGVSISAISHDGGTTWTMLTFYGANYSTASIHYENGWYSYLNYDFYRTQNILELTSKSSIVSGAVATNGRPLYAGVPTKIGRYIYSVYSGQVIKTDIVGGGHKTMAFLPKEAGTYNTTFSSNTILALGKKWIVAGYRTGALYVTLDEGATWQVALTGLTSGVEGIHLLNNNKILAITNNNKAALSTADLGGGYVGSPVADWVDKPANTKQLYIRVG